MTAKGWINGRFLEGLVGLSRKFPQRFTVDHDRGGDETKPLSNADRGVVIRVNPGPDAGHLLITQPGQHGFGRFGCDASVLHGRSNKPRHVCNQGIILHGESCLHVSARGPRRLYANDPVQPAGVIARRMPDGLSSVPRAEDVFGWWFATGETVKLGCCKGRDHLGSVPKFERLED